jgi:methylaspartate ammonia-lyase
MKIEQVIVTPGYSGFYFDDQKAIKAGAEQDGFWYIGDPVTPGFSAIRQAGECISLQLVLENGQVALGDCAAVQYSGAGGRDPLFLAETYIPFFETHLVPLLVGQPVDQFLPLSKRFQQLRINGKPLHTALRYGISQALLHATALTHTISMAEVIIQEYGLPLMVKPVPLFAQTGDDRYLGVDKMILKGAQVLPHGLINNIPNKLGYKGEKLAEYVAWLKNRVAQLRSDDSYVPDLHIDVYGTLGIIFQNQAPEIAKYLEQLQHIAEPHQLYIEGPVDLGGKQLQIQSLLAIKQQLDKLGSRVKIVADEWCNTLEDVMEFVDAQCCHMVQIKTPDLGCIHSIVDAVLYAKQGGVEAYQGGTCNETDISAKTCVHLAIAAQPDRMLVKPGMGFDEGMTIVQNEMTRTLGLLKNRTVKQSNSHQSSMGAAGSTSPAFFQKASRGRSFDSVPITPKLNTDSLSNPSTPKEKDRCVILSPTAILGYGFPLDSFQAGLDHNPDVIAVDAGSTDPGPYYLGSGKSFTDRAGVKRDLRIILREAIPRGIPVLVGTAGGSGANPHLQWTLDIIREIAQEEALGFTLAHISSELSNQQIQHAFERGDLSPLEHQQPLSLDDIIKTPHVVAQMGIERFIDAFNQGAQVIVAGRAYDPSVFAALPVLWGFDKGLSIHLGKILECAAIAASPGSGSDCALGILWKDRFELVPLNQDRSYTSESVAAHSLYEKSDPYHLPGPGGVLDLTNTRFTELPNGRVEVRGSTYIPSEDYAIKLEGSRCLGYRTISIAGIRDPILIPQLDQVLDQVTKRAQMILEKEGVAGQVWFHTYGKDGVMGPLTPETTQNAQELGIVIDVVAPTQQEANTRCSVIRSTLLHYGYNGRISTAGNLAFPFSPSDIPAGPVFDFSLYHLMRCHPDQLADFFPVILEQVEAQSNGLTQSSLTEGR